MRKHFIAASMLLAASLSSQAATPDLKGFDYGNADAPTGKEWESPQQLAYNKLQPKAYFFSFADVASAKKVLPENSRYYQSLNGEWKFNWVNTPEKRPADFYKTDYDVSGWDNIAVPGCWNVQGIQPDGSLKYGVPIYVNQPVIFQHKVAVDDWRGGVMRTPPENWTTYKDRNEVGSYRRTFTVPADWNGREIYINFDGVDSFFYLWVNGKYVGFSKNSRNTATFDITDLVVKGENTVAVEVYRNSDGSFLEAQDMFRLPGIIRDTYLTSTPKVAISDLVVRTLSIDKNGEAKMKVDVTVDNLSKKDAKGYSVSYSFYPCGLYSDETAANPAITESLPAKAMNITK
ncbi:MAG: beta galactosidase jelly roll domain-containing protein, partial [Muribaculaceae bacterium]|nr:beta galactosidase jelly roll domain-containing protein [Muribaculaceae bacterium]